MKKVLCAFTLVAVYVWGFAGATRATQAPPYSAVATGDIVRLEDTRAGVTVSIVVPMSNAYEMVVKGHQIIRKTFKEVGEFREKPGLNGIPLLAPFANRLDEPAFYANGKKYNFDMELGNVRGARPSHGFLSAAKDRKLDEAKTDARGAWVTRWSSASTHGWYGTNRSSSQRP